MNGRGHVPIKLIYKTLGGLDLARGLYFANLWSRIPHSEILWDYVLTSPRSTQLVSEAGIPMQVSRPLSGAFLTAGAELPLPVLMRWLSCSLAIPARGNMCAVGHIEEKGKKIEKTSPLSSHFNQKIKKRKNDQLCQAHSECE